MRTADQGKRTIATAKNELQKPTVFISCSLYASSAKSLIFAKNFWITTIKGKDFPLFLYALIVSVLSYNFAIIPLKKFTLFNPFSFNYFLQPYPNSKIV